MCQNTRRKKESPHTLLQLPSCSLFFLNPTIPLLAVKVTSLLYTHTSLNDESSTYTCCYTIIRVATERRKVGYIARRRSRAKRTTAAASFCAGLVYTRARLVYCCVSRRRRRRSLRAIFLNRCCCCCCYFLFAIRVLAGCLEEFRAIYGASAAGNWNKGVAIYESSFLLNLEESQLF